jgi:hypothetical protein
MKNRRLPPLLIALCCLLPAAAAGRAEDKDLAGSWEGPVVWSPGDIEVDVVVDLARDPRGGWSGKLAAPTASVEGHVLAKVTVEGRSISFEHTDRPERGRFRGTLTPDGQKIEGEFVQADGASARFALRRRAAPRAPVPEVGMLSGPDDLRDLFNADRGAPRLVLLLAPTCELCRIGSRLTQRYVMEAIDSAALHAYVIWLPMSDEDTHAAARRAAADLPDRRVRQFWTADLAIARAFAQTLGVKQEPAWDVFLVYGPDAVWQAGPPPAPRSYMHRSGELPKQLEYNALRLADQVRAALPR